MKRKVNMVGRDEGKGVQHRDIQDLNTVRTIVCSHSPMLNTTFLQIPASFPVGHSFTLGVILLCLCTALAWRWDIQQAINFDAFEYINSGTISRNPNLALIVNCAAIQPSYNMEASFYATRWMPRSASDALLRFRLAAPTK